jgi:hypothetical protein
MTWRAISARSYCGGCDAVFHPAGAGLAGVPEGDWFCQLCTDAGVTDTGAGQGLTLAHFSSQPGPF